MTAAFLLFFFWFDCLEKLGSVHITLFRYVASSFCFQFLSVLCNLKFNFSKLFSSAFVDFRDTRCFRGRSRRLFGSAWGILFDGGRYSG